MAKIIGNFFHDYWSSWCLLFLVEFEVDGMRPNESTKNGRKGAHGLNWKILSILRSFSKPNLKPISKFSWSDLYGPYDGSKFELQTPKKQQMQM